MLLSVNHEIAPKEDALGNYGCIDCHGIRVIDWSALGWSGDPLMGGYRNLEAEAEVSNCWSPIQGSAE